jgi:sulfur-oxidizing protein SoxA
MFMSGAFMSGAALAQTDATEKEIERYRQMLKADPWSNPGHLDVDRGEGLWKKVRGPKNVSLEACDFGKGPGKLDGVFAELPRYFADADRVMDLESRILWCMEKLQGIERKDINTRWPGGGLATNEVAAIATFVASKSAGAKFALAFKHPKEQEMLNVGEAMFFRRQGPMDFACATCHADAGKRIRLQGLPYLEKEAEAKKVIGEWPAYRVSNAHVMTMQHRIYDCFWQMRLPQVEMGSDITIALTSYLVSRANGGEISVPGLKR